MKNNPSKQLSYYYRNKHKILKKIKLKRFLKHMETKLVKYQDLMDLYKEVQNEIDPPKMKSVKVKEEP